MYTIGISAYYHDSAVALLKEGKLIAALSEERLTRVKNDARFPAMALSFLLQEYKITNDQIDAIVFYDKPWLKFERILESCIRYAPRSWSLFVKSMPIWLSQKLNFRKLLKKELNKIQSELGKKNIYFSEHHFSHVASSVYTSPFTDCVAISLDGVGEWATLSIYDFQNNKFDCLKEMHYPDSLGLLYSAFTVFCGFKVNSGEYKLMGLAPYGIKESSQTESFIKQIKTQLVNIFEDGSIQLNLDYFSFQYGDKTINEKKWHEIFKINPRNPDGKLTQDYCNFALAAQTVTEEIILNIIKHGTSLSDSKNLCLSGGVALNCVANSKIQALGIFENIWIHPAPGDAGGAVGAALGYYHQKHPYIPIEFTPYLGPEYSTKEIEKSMEELDLTFEKMEMEKIYPLIAKEILAGKIIGWFQDRMEWGPRALGNRSILASALDPQMQKELNLKIKFREGFRPFAPITIEEEAMKHFDLNANASYMQYTFAVKNITFKNKHGLSAGLSSVDSPLPAITHVDGSARLQTVNKKQNPKMYQLLEAYYQISGTPVLVNTSFNVRGEPIVCHPKDAIECFLATNIDVLVLDDYVIFKNQNKNLTISERYFSPD